MKEEKTEKKKKNPEREMSEADVAVWLLKFFGLLINCLGQCTDQTNWEVLRLNCGSTLRPNETRSFPAGTKKIIKRSTRLHEIVNYPRV